MDPNVVFKNIVVAALLLGFIALAALGFRPGSVGTVGTGGWSGGGDRGGYSWGGGDDD